jgi:hypothetical protein
MRLAWSIEEAEYKIGFNFYWRSGTEVVHASSFSRDPQDHPDGLAAGHSTKLARGSAASEPLLWKHPANKCHNPDPRGRRNG